jgi:hypothetical protein
MADGRPRPRLLSAYWPCLGTAVLVIDRCTRWRPPAQADRLSSGSAPAAVPPRYQADATPYLGRTFTGLDRTSFSWRTYSITSSASPEGQSFILNLSRLAAARFSQHTHQSDVPYLCRRLAQAKKTAFQERGPRKTSRRTYARRRHSELPFANWGDLSAFPFRQLAKGYIIRRTGERSS